MDLLLGYASPEREPDDMGLVLRGGGDETQRLGRFLLKAVLEASPEWLASGGPGLPRPLNALG
jgi:hypothetical protein